jgi:hypothetical protein
MTKDTLILTLNGEIPLAEFAKALEHFSELVGALSNEIAGSLEVEWEVVHLESGSATASVQGSSTMEGVVERIVEAYETVGRSLEIGAPIPYSDQVIEEAKAITRVLNGKIKSVSFKTDQFEAEVVEPSSEVEVKREYLPGTITGEVDTLSRRRGLKFMLYDHLFDKAVVCNLKENQQEIMREAWGKRVTVHGSILRDPETGRPLAAHNITKVEIHPDNLPGSYKRARGAIPWKEGMELPESVIRRLRDG